uniref:Putative secreted protein n=1 Tax=Ixodes ricinus TaxID=34613 RepID=A0A6B0UW02_IXORI
MASRRAITSACFFALSPIVVKTLKKQIKIRTKIVNPVHVCVHVTHKSKVYRYIRCGKQQRVGMHLSHKARSLPYVGSLPAGSLVSFSRHYQDGGRSSRRATRWRSTFRIWPILYIKGDISNALREAGLYFTMVLEVKTSIDVSLISTVIAENLRE